MRLTEESPYRACGLDSEALRKLALLGDRLLGAGFNVIGATDAEGIEHFHFLDSLSLLTLAVVSGASSVVDLGSGAGLPALVLAIARPAEITAVESQRKKCTFIAESAELLGLENVTVRCVRAEDYGREEGREAHDVVVSRALASLPVIAEYSFPLLCPGGTMVAMKGDISNQERTQAQEALDILGGGPLESIRLDPFPGAQNRWVHMSRKIRVTASEYPRRAGIPAKRPLGS
jgi:16S rRNA (guanine527-N7)-methyltransferase